MKHENKKLGASFTLPEDLTQRQLEDWERTTRELTEGPITPALASRAAIHAAIVAGFFNGGDKVPGTLEELDDSSARINWWVSDTIGKFVREIKTLETVNDPNS